MIELHGKRAQLEASERANAALHAEDMDTYDTWQAISGAVTGILFPNFAAHAFEEPRKQFSEADVWAAAKQMMELYAEYPSLTAAQLADTALDEGDMEGAGFWVRVTKALENMERQSPHDGEAMN